MKIRQNTLPNVMMDGRSVAIRVKVKGKRIPYWSSENDFTDISNYFFAIYRTIEIMSRL